MIITIKGFIYIFLLTVLTNKCLSLNHPKRQMRGVWIASVENIDWPSKTGLTVEQQKIEYKKLLNEAKTDNLNAIFMQIRPTADSFYPSKLFPWSQWLTGHQGVDPGYDPLEFMVKETHDLNMEFHAWFNPYRISSNYKKTNLSDDNIAKKHPEWVIYYGDISVFNPGIPEVREYIISGILEVVQNYDIDGIHFDDYFYPYPNEHEFPDKSSFEKYGKHFEHISDWRRNNTNILIEEIHKRSKAINPSIKFGISPFGVWRNIATDHTGSNTTAGVQCYDDLYADTRAWIKAGWIDYILPQIYWLIGFKPAPYDVLVEWWDREVSNSNVQLYVGHAATRVDSVSDVTSGWKNPNVIEEQMVFNSKYSNVKGSVFWNINSLMNNKINFRNILRNNSLSRPALMPESVNEKHDFNASVVIEKAIKKSKTTVELVWSLMPSIGSNMTSYFVIYRFNGIVGHKTDISTADEIQALVRYNEHNVNQTFIDHIDEQNDFTYFVSPVTRHHIEGHLSDPFVFKSLNI